MSKEYAIYPFKYMNITQRHDQGSHIPNWQNSTNWIDLPWDEALNDGGRSYFEPQNDFIIEEVLGLGNNITNTVRLKSINKLYLPYKEEPDYLYLTLSHMNEDNLGEVVPGQILKKGSKILLEGTDGLTTGNHFHITANLGKYYGFLQNNNGAWCFTYEQSLLPNEAFYIDSNYTNSINDAGYKFVNIPKEEMLIIGDGVPRDESKDQIEIISSILHCRKLPGLNEEILGYIKPGIYNYTESVVKDGYTWYYIGYGWVAYNEEWDILYPKKEIIPSSPEKKLNFFQKIIKKIVDFIRNIYKRK